MLLGRNRNKRASGFWYGLNPYIFLELTAKLVHNIDFDLIDHLVGVYLAVYWAEKGAKKQNLQEKGNFAPIETPQS